MELDLKWRRKRSGRRLRPPFIAAPPANREGCCAVTWRWLRRAPCRAEPAASDGSSGASCRGARGRQWERLREAKVAGAEGNNGGGAWESRGGTSIAALPVRSEGSRAWEERRASGARNPERRCRRTTVPLALRAFVSGVRSGPRLAKSRRRRLGPPSVPQSGAAAMAAPVGQHRGPAAPALAAEAASARPLVRAHACFVLELAGTSRTGSGRSGAARASLPLGARGRGGPPSAARPPPRPGTASSACRGGRRGGRPGRAAVNMQKRRQWAGWGG